MQYVRPPRLPEETPERVLPDGLWELTLLGGMSARRGDLVVSRFRTRKTAHLFAYLAFYIRRRHAREELCEMLWPDSSPEDGRSSLRMALASLRRQMEPPGTPTGTVLQADRTHLSLNPDAARCDAVRFTDALREADRAASDEMQVRRLVEAVDFYGGPLLPGVYEDWALAERDHLQEAYLGALLRLAALFRAQGDLGRALDYAGRAVAADPLREEAHRDLIRLYLEAGQNAAARHQYEELARRLREELDEAPAAVTWALVQDLPPQVSRPAESQALRARPPDPVAPKVSAPPDPEIPRVYGLPLFLTRFFGREEAVRTLQEKLFDPSSRLVTLTGPGGSGKTRLAAEAAPQVGAALGGPVVFVPLAALSDPARLAGAVADILRLPRTTADALDQIVEALSQSPTLLVLDNMEQFGEGGAFFAHALLERLPTLTCLATSRHRLSLAGEQEILVLPLPTPSHPGTPERLLEFASVQLFADRAQAARPDFQVTRRNAETVAALCHRLEGIPLAIELAAGWSGALTPAQMLARLGRRFELLVARRQDSSPRHRTLWATIDWSYRLLPADLRDFFARLCVFRGGWTLEAAEAVCAEPRALELLAELRDRSLVTAEEEAGGMRFRLLETLREFGAEQLGAEAREVLAQGHAGYFSSLAVEAEPHLTGADQGLWLDRLEDDHDNLRAALDWYTPPEADADAGLRLAVSLLKFWEMRGFFSEGRARFAALLARPGEDWEARAGALNGSGSLAWRQGDFAAARRMGEEGLEIARREGCRPLVCELLYNLAVVLMKTGDRAASRRRLQESLEIAQQLGQPYEVSRTLNSLAILAFEDADHAAARQLLQESLAIKRRVGDWHGAATALLNLAHVAVQQEDLAAAQDLAEEAVALNREIGSVPHLANALSSLAEIVWKRGDVEAARRLFAECLPLRRRAGDHDGVAYTLESCAELARAQGDAERAACLLGASSALFLSCGVILTPREQEKQERLRSALRAHLGAAYEEAVAQGAALAPEQAVALAVGGLLTEVPARNTSQVNAS